MKEEDWQKFAATGVTGVIVGTWGIWQYFRNSYRPSALYKLQNKSIIVTGANTGVGFATANQLARNGATVVLACRNVKLGEEAVRKIRAETGNEAVTCEYLDLSNLRSIREFSSKVKRCHVLVNNAGAMFSESETVHGVEKTFFTNYLGPFLLTTLLLPVLAETSIAEDTEVRVVVVGSRSEKASPLGALYSQSEECDSKEYSAPVNESKQGWFESCVDGPKPYALWTAYGTSKLCDMLFAYELDRRLGSNQFHTKSADTTSQTTAAPSKSTRLWMGRSPTKTSIIAKTDNTIDDMSKARITVNCVTPGMVNSDLSRWAPQWKLYLSYPLRASWLRTVEQGAEGVVHVCASPDLNGVSGKYFADGKQIESSPASHNPDLARDLWDESEKLLKTLEVE